MEKVAETPLRSPEQAENTLLELKTPLQNGQTDEQIPQESGNELKKTNTPDRLKVPKAFKYTERYVVPSAREALWTFTQFDCVKNLSSFIGIEALLIQWCHQYQKDCLPETERELYFCRLA